MVGEPGHRVGLGGEELLLALVEGYVGPHDLDRDALSRPLLLVEEDVGETAAPEVLDELEPRDDRRAHRSPTVAAAEPTSKRTS